MAGQFLENQHLIVFAKDEIYHLLFSVALLASVGGIIAFSCVLSSSILDFSMKTLPSTVLSLNTACYSSSDNIFAVSSCFINNVRLNAEWNSKNALVKSIKKQQEAVTMFSLYVPLMGGVTTSTQAYKRTHGMLYDLLYTSFLSPVLISITVQSQLIDFIKIFTPGILLPLAFMMRIFPVTRGIGNMLIGLSIGLVTIFPIFYTLNAAMFDAVFSNCNEMEGITNDWVLGQCGVPGSFFDIARLIPQAFFLPNLTLAVFITFLSAMNRALKVIG